MSRIPGPLLRALAGASYESPNDFARKVVSVTTLLQPPRIAVLRARHTELPPPPPEEAIAALIGTGGHKALEELARPPERAEVRLTCPITRTGWTLSGMCDLYDPSIATLFDYKYTKASAFPFGPKPDWTAQLNMLDYLFTYNQLHVSGLIAVQIAVDYNPAELERSKPGKYPTECIKCHDIDIWQEEETIEFMEERVRALESALAELPLCTDEERWAGRLRDGSTIYRRCQKWCPVRSVCDMRDSGT